MHHAAGDKCSAGGMTASRPIPLIPQRLSGNDHVLRDHLHRICVHMVIILKTARGSFGTVILRIQRRGRGNMHVRVKRGRTWHHLAFFQWRCRRAQLRLNSDIVDVQTDVPIM